LASCGGIVPKGVSDRSAAVEKQKDLTSRDGKSAHALVAQHCLEAEDAEIKIGRMLQRVHVQRALENASDRWRDAIHSLRTLVHRSGFPSGTTNPAVAAFGLDLLGVELSYSRIDVSRPVRLCIDCCRPWSQQRERRARRSRPADLAVLVALLAGFYMLLMCAAPR
jgi:hypothetical protein